MFSKWTKIFNTYLLFMFVKLMILCVPANAALYANIGVHTNPISVCFVGDALTSRPDRVQEVEDFMLDFVNAANINFEFIGTCPAATTQSNGDDFYGGDIRIIMPGINISGTGPVPGNGCPLYEQTTPDGYNGENDGWGSWSRWPDDLPTMRSCLYNLKLGDDGGASGPYTDHTLHEVGHGLGMAHEHERSDGICNPQDPDVDDARGNPYGHLTPFDINSVMHYKYSPPNYDCDTDGNYSYTGLSKWDELGFHILYPEPNLPAEFVGETLLHTGETLRLQSTLLARGANISFVANNFEWRLDGVTVSNSPELVWPMSSVGEYLLEFSYSDFLGRNYYSSTTIRVDGPLRLAKDFNLFILGDVVHNYTDVQGRLAAGGDASFSGYSVGFNLNGSSGTRDDLIVGGEINWSNGTVANGNAVSGGAANLNNVTFLNGNSYRQQIDVIDFEKESNYLKGLAIYWSRFLPNGTTTSVQYYGSTAEVTFTGSNSNINIFNILGSDIAAAHSLTINAPASSTVLINIHGFDNQMQNFGFTLNGVSRNNVIYNFYQTTSLTLQSIAVQGSILAPNADVTFPHGNIDGTLIAESLTGGGQAHHYPFNGILPAPNTVLDVVEVGAPAINCLFDNDCVITVIDSTQPLTLMDTSGDGFVQSRQFPIGEPGTAGEGLYTYLYRVDIRNQVHPSDTVCVSSVDIDAGYITPFDFDESGDLDDVFVITSGGLGNSPVTRATKAGGIISFEFDQLICTGNKAPHGDNSFLFGFASEYPSKDIQLEVTDRSGVSYAIGARAPDSPK